MMKKKLKRNTNIKPAKKLNCYFCENKRDPDYKDVDTISKFVSDRSRILSRGRSGVCNKHQRKLAISIKRLRHLALLPFKVAI